VSMSDLICECQYGNDCSKISVCRAAERIEELEEYRDVYREQFITLQTDYKKLEAENERLRVVYDAAIKIQPELTLVSKVLRKAIQEDGDDLS